MNEYVAELNQAYRERLRQDTRPAEPTTDRIRVARMPGGRGALEITTAGGAILTLEADLTTATLSGWHITYVDPKTPPAEPAEEEPCCDDQLSSHYHCANCGKRCGMMGHLTSTGIFSCEPKRPVIAE